MKYFFLIVFAVLLHQSVFAQHKAAYRIVVQDGEFVDYDQMKEELEIADVILFGEMHDNPICHWLEFELLKDLHNDSTQQVVLALEMIERDNNELLQKYLAGELSHEEFDSTARLWNNYVTDYKPLIDYAKEQEIQVVGTNVPRRYASTIYKDGFSSLDSLSLDEREWLAPLPIEYDKELPGYKNILSLFDDASHVNENLPKAQAIKDATMAYFISKSIEQGQVMLHLNGSYHSENFEGIVWYLKKYNPQLNIKTIASKEQRQVQTIDEENKGIADFIIIVNELMSKSY